MISLLDNYEVKSTVGRGASGTVKVVAAEGLVYAAKVIKLESDEAREAATKEFSIMRQLTHPGIVQVHQYSTNGNYVKKSNGEITSCAYILMELCPNGNLLSLITQKDFLPENICRFYFLAIAQALDAMHTLGYSHRDIKPENILLDAQWMPKLTDFGISTLSQGSRGDFVLQTRAGTENYMAPEVYNREQYDGPLADVYSLGKLLFLIYSKHPPFVRPTLGEKFYRGFERDQPWFWNAHSQKKPPGFFSLDFKQLIVGMLASDPNRRLSLSDVLNHPWCTGTVATPEEVTSKMEERNKMMMENAVLSKSKVLEKEKNLMNPEEERYKFMSDELTPEDLTRSYSSPDDIILKPAPVIYVKKYASIPTGLPIKDLLDIIYKALTKYGNDYPYTIADGRININLVTQTDTLRFFIDFYDWEGFVMLDFKHQEGDRWEMLKIFKKVSKAIESKSLS